MAMLDIEFLRASIHINFNGQCFELTLNCPNPHKDGKVDPNS